MSHRLTLSLTLVLLLLGLIALWASQASYLADQLRMNMDVVVELEDDYAAAEYAALENYLLKTTYLRPGARPELIGKDAALAALGPEVAADLADLEMNNPLRDLIRFNVVAEYLQRDSLEAIATALQARPGVAGVYYQADFVDRVAANARTLTYVLAGTALLFLLIVIYLIHTTVRLDLHANRFLLKTQQLVGASGGFITRPYVWRAFWQGLLAGVLAASLLAVGWYLLDRQFPELVLLGRWEPVAVVLGGVVGVGVLVNVLSHWVVVRRYLRRRVEDLY